MTIRQIFTTGPGGTGPTFVHQEETSVDDKFILGTIEADEATVDDKFIYGSVQQEKASVDDSFSFSLLKPTLEEAANVNDLTKIHLYNVASERSATPDNDLITDLYIDQASPSTNFGNTDLLIKRATVAPGNDQMAAFMLFDFTKFSNFIAYDDPAEFDFCLSVYVYVSTPDALGKNLSHTFYYSDTKPLTESVATWNNPPASGTIISNGNIPSLTPTPTLKILGMSASGVQQALGKWLFIVFTQNNVLDNGLFTSKVESRDQTTNQPMFDLHIKRGI